MSINKNTLIMYVLFILSPLLSLPLIFLQLKKKLDKGIIFIFSLFIAILSYRYIPNLTNDKARYIERSEMFSNFSFSQLLDYFSLVKRPDFIFDTINFIFSKLDVSIGFFFFFITFSTVYLSFKFVKLVCENYFGGKFNFDLLTFSFVLFSFSLPGIFSGLRFAFAGSIFSLGIYFLLTREQNPRNIIFSFSLFTLSILTHFSYIGLFLPVLVILLKMRRIKLNILLIVSILLLFVAPLTKGYFESILKLISLPEGYSNKTSLYLEMENSNTFNSEVLLFVKSLWFYFLPIILFLDRAKTHLCPIVIATYFIVCIVSFVDTAFIRYMLFLKLLVVPYLILLLYSGRLKFGFFFGFFLLYFLGFCIDLLVLRNNILASFTSGMWNIFSIFYDTRASYMNVVGS